MPIVAKPTRRWTRRKKPRRSAKSLAELKMSNCYEIVREYFPEATDELCEFIIWEKTGYPQFWNIPEDGNTPEECFRKQLQDVANPPARLDRERTRQVSLMFVFLGGKND